MVLTKLLNELTCIKTGCHALATLVIMTAYDAEDAAYDSTTCCVHTLLAVSNASQSVDWSA